MAKTFLYTNVSAFDGRDGPRAPGAGGSGGGAGGSGGGAGHSGGGADGGPGVLKGHRRLLSVCASIVLLAGCAKAKPRGVPALPGAGGGFVEDGLASWYGYPYHGRMAANGEVYDMEQFTAAHRTLEFGTWVRVTNLENRRSVAVRITDRGPFVEGRIIDLSRAAARALDLLSPGVARVRLEILSTPPPLSPVEGKSELGAAAQVSAAGPEVALYAVQVGAFRDRANAERFREEMERQFGSARLALREGDPRLWRVLVGREASLEGAQALAERLKDQGLVSFVVRLDPQ